MRKLLSIVVAFASTFVFAQQTSVNDSISLKEVVVTSGRGTVDLASSRQTPISVTTIGRTEIENKIGQEDLVNIMINTPGVTVTDQAGGFGDSDVFVRGFDQTNTAFLLNGQPINGAEDGKMYWSNWSGLADVSQGVQVQRGLGASKIALATSSVGGSVNFIFKATGKEKGGFYTATVGSDNYSKYGVSYDTGVLENGWAVSMFASYWKGDGYAEQAYGEGNVFFLSLGKKIGEKHTINALATMAPQIHGMAFGERISEYLEYGERFNDNWGYDVNGNPFNERQNFYNKPVLNLTWDWEISDITTLSTVAYASYGRGGSTGSYGSSSRDVNGKQFDYSGIFFDNLDTDNEADQGDSGYFRRVSMNLHNWFGITTNYETNLGDNFTLDVGAELRTYYGYHTKLANNMLGLESFYENGNQITADTTYPATGWGATWQDYSDVTSNGHYVDYNYSENINQGGIFAQLEYAKDNFTAFVQGSVSNQTHIRFDDYHTTAATRTAPEVSRSGFNFKGGFSYKLSENAVLFANGGYYDRQPFHDRIYEFSNNVNPLAENEKITSFELGYKLQTNDFNLYVDVYSIDWKNRISSSRNDGYAEANPGVDQTLEYFNRTSGLHQLHTGLEFEADYKLSDALKLRTWGSFGNWEFQDDLLSQIVDERGGVITSNVSVNADGVKVGGGAQTQFGLGVNYKVNGSSYIDIDFRNNADQYAWDFDFNAVEDEVKIPSYSLVDLGVTKILSLGNNDLKVRFNLYNLLNEQYLTVLTSFYDVNPGDETWKGINTRSYGRFGKRRTFTLSLKYDF